MLHSLSFDHHDYVRHQMPSTTQRRRSTTRRRRTRSTPTASKVVARVDDGQGRQRSDVPLRDLLMENGVAARAAASPNRCPAWFEPRTHILQGFRTTIEFQEGGWFCGYVHEYVGSDTSWMRRDRRTRVFKSATSLHIGDLSRLVEKSPEAIYEPHGGYTAPNGFDCFGSRDAAIWMTRTYGPAAVRVFRSAHFVYDELMQVVASLCQFLQRKTPTTRRRASPPKPSGGATRDERATAAEYRQRYWTPKHVYKQLCGIVHADDTRPASPFAVPTLDATWTQKPSWKG